MPSQKLKPILTTESNLEPKFQKFIGFLINSMAEFFQTEISDNAKKKRDNGKFLYQKMF